MGGVTYIYYSVHVRRFDAICSRAKDTCAAVEPPVHAPQPRHLDRPIPQDEHGQEHVRSTMLLCHMLAGPKRK